MKKKLPASFLRVEDHGSICLEQGFLSGSAIQTLFFMGRRMKNNKITVHRDDLDSLGISPAAFYRAKTNLYRNNALTILGPNRYMVSPYFLYRGHTSKLETMLEEFHSLRHDEEMRKRENSKRTRK